MRKIPKKTIGILLVIVLCFSMIPMSAMARSVDIGQSLPGVMEQNSDENRNAPDDNVVPDEEESQPDIKDNETNNIQQGQLNQETAPTDSDTPSVADSGVGAPFAQVVYNYYDAAQSQDILGFVDYAVTSAHSYHTLAVATDVGVTITANKYPGVVPVSTDKLRFCVLMNGNENITAFASYDAATGLVSLPTDYAGQDLSVVWYCPETDVAKLPVKATIGVYSNGSSSVTEQRLLLMSNAAVIEIPLSGVDRIVVNQNGLDLQESEYSYDNDVLTVKASPLGGDLIISAFRAKSSGGFSVMGASTTVSHERQHYNSVNYGYVTSYYVANGNVAYCLDPSVSGVNSGNYDISGYMERGTGNDNIIKSAWYLYQCPGEISSLFSGLDWEHAYGYSHVAASYIYLEAIGGDTGKAWKGIESNTAARNAIMGIVDTIKAQPMPPEGFSVFLYNVGNQTSQSLMGWEYTPTGNLEIQKVSSDPSKTDGNDCYSLEGAVFGVYNGSDDKIDTITTDADGKGRLEGIAAGQTGLYILEEKAPEGYAESTAKIPFEIVSGQTTVKEIKNIPKGDPVTILMRKQDEDTKTNTPQGNASFEGAQYTIKYYKGHYTESQLDGKKPARTWIVEIDEYGFAMLHLDFLVAGSDPLYYASNGTTPTIPLGTVTLQETKVPTSGGYLLNDELIIRQVTATGKMEPVNTYNAPTFLEEVVRGGFVVQKRDFQVNQAGQPQGDADLKAVLDVYNRSAEAVEVNGKSFAPNENCYTITTDAVTGEASTANDLLPFGDYEILERTNGGAPTGYLNKGRISQKFSIKTDGEIVKLNTGETAILNEVIRGSVKVYKLDQEIMESRSQGSGTLAGAEFEILNTSKHQIVNGDGEIIQPGEVACVIVTEQNADGTYSAQTPDLYLSYGSYLCREVSPPFEGYLATGKLTQEFKIREHGVLVELDDDKAIQNPPIRGDLRGVKVSDHDAKRMAGVPFSIKSVTTGESHTVVTDQNGEFSTHSSWNPHSQNTNRGETDRDGIWFGELWTLDDDNGALLYDTYLIEEQPCKENENRELLSFEVNIYRHLTTVDLSTLINPLPDNPEIFTTAMDKETAQNDAHVAEQTTILDTVYYSGLKVGKEYTLKGVLMDKETGDPLLVDGKEVTAETTFRAMTDNGTVPMEFTVNTLALRGKSVVVFESLEFEGEEIAVHAEIEDEGQTVNFKDPQIGTSAAGTEGEKELDIFPETTIVDTVSFENLIIDQTYTLKGILMDKATDEPLLIDGEQVTSEKTFIAKAESGTIDITFTVNAALLKGTSVVVFESLEYKGREIAVHAEIEDEGQTVTFKEPKIGTSATGAEGEKELDIFPEVTIVDVVSYEGLAAGETYTVKGVLMDKSTGEPLLMDEKEVTAETTFVAKEASGTVEVVFTLDALTLKGKEVVVYESLYYGETEIAVHTDIEDEGQTVKFKEPKIGTNATGADGGKEVLAAKTATIIDVVSFDGLAVGKTYTVKGVLMDKSTGEPLLVGEKQVTAETTFVAKETSGTVEVVFTLDALELKGKEVVVFETLYCNESEIAIHADIEDENQTVVFKDIIIRTSATGEDGSKTIPVSETAKVIDVVTYENLTAHEEYTVKGILMDKETEKAVLVNGQEVTAQTTFVPKESSGSVKVEFVFNSTALEKKVLVVFESLEYEGKEIAAHADINDDAQTVGVGIPTPDAPGTTGGGAKTGQSGLPFWLLFVAIGATAGAFILYRRYKKKQAQMSE